MAATFARIKRNKAKRLFYPMVSFIVPAYNEEKSISRCIKSLFKCATKYAGLCEIIVVDDGSRDYTYETFYPLSTVRAFQNLENILGAKTLDEISFPYQHLVQSITAEKYDEATHALKMVEGYATELMEKAGYNEKQIDKILNRLLYNVEAHEEVIPLEKAKDLELKVKHFTENLSLLECWKTMKTWLRKYFLRPSPIHFIRHCFPCEISETTSTELKKDEAINNK